MIIWAVASLAFGAFVLYKHAPQLRLLFSEHKKYSELEKNPPNLNVLYELIDFSKEYYQFSPNLENFVAGIKDDFLKDSLKTFLGGAVRGHDMLRALRKRADARYEANVAKICDLRSISKFLPAVGWAVALCATFWLFGTGTSVENYMLRSSFAFTTIMVSIFYGLSVLYYFVEPTVLKIEKLAYAVRAKDILVIEAISHLMKKNTAYEVFEAVNLNLPEDKKLKYNEFFPSTELKAS